MTSNDDTSNYRQRKDSFGAISRVLFNNSPRNSLIGKDANDSTISTISLQRRASSQSSIIDFADNSMDGIIDTLDFEDIDEGIIDSEYMYRNRESIIENLLNSEEAYTESLELAMKLFYIPLKKSTTHSSFTFLGIKKTICTESEFKSLFGNFEELVYVHQLTLKSLKERLRIWGPTQILSDVLQAWFPNLDGYQTYLDNYSVAMTTYESLTKHQLFKKFLDNANKEESLRGSNLLRLLQLPVGCIDRYLGIITKLVDSTPPMHPDYAGLYKSRLWLLKFHKSLKNRLLDAKNVTQVLFLQQSLIGASFSTRADRRLILQGKLTRVALNSRLVGEERHYILFSDMLVFSKPKAEDKFTKLHYKGHLILERARVRALTKEEASGIDHCIEIVTAFSGMDNLSMTFEDVPTVHILSIGSEEERKLWLTKLETVIHNLDTIIAAQVARRMIHNKVTK